MRHPVCFSATDAGASEPPIRLPTAVAVTADADAGAQERIQGLIRERNAARSDAQEARAELAEAQESITTLKTEAASAVTAAKAEMGVKLAELEGQLRRGKNRELLLADKIPEEGMDDLLEYLDYQYGKVSATTDGTDPPEFDAWYRDARKTNRVLRAAMKPSIAAAAATDGESATAAPVVSKPPRVPAAIPPKAAVIAPKPGETTSKPDFSKIKLGTPEFAAAKEAARRAWLSGSR